MFAPMKNTAYEDMPLGDAAELVMAIIDEEAAEASNVFSSRLARMWCASMGNLIDNLQAAA